MVVVGYGLEGQRPVAVAAPLQNGGLGNMNDERPQGRRQGRRQGGQNQGLSQAAANVWGRGCGGDGGGGQGATAPEVCDT